MSNSSHDAYQSLCQHARETEMLVSIDGLLGWDERTKMPPAAGPYRAEQIAYLAGEIHKRQTDPRVGEWLEQLAEDPVGGDPHSDVATNVRELRRLYLKKTRLPQSLVEELSRTSVLGQQVWVEARKDDDFKLFQPILEKTFELKRQEAAAIGFETNAYDALLDAYEPGATVAEVSRVLGGLRDAVLPLLDRIRGFSQQPNSEILQRKYPVDRQEQFGREAATAIGFDFSAGRLDVTDHPFCAEAGPRDVRLTTRYRDSDLADAFFSTLHEAGHGVYEQGLPEDQYGLPTGKAVSLGIHESQSRMWENQVGRSRAFWDRYFPRAQQIFPEAFGDAQRDEFYASVNLVEPSLIRVEADEVTYNLHIFIRFEMEQALLAGDLPVGDLPGEWRERYAANLGVTPPNDADGAMQDVHWSAGLVGYFPTYALGNLYAAQFFRQAGEELGDLDSIFRGGEFGALLNWLREKIYQHGQRYSASELAQRITGGPLTHEAWQEQMTSKYGALYDF